MPGPICHCLCAKAAAKFICPGARRVISGNMAAFYAGAQGPDVFLYFPTGFSRMAGLEAHTGNFALLIKEMCQAAGRGGEARKAYVLGYLTHYVLDAAAHPYVYWKCGAGTDGDRRSILRHSAMHKAFEAALDVLMLRRLTGKDVLDIRIWRLTRPNSHDLWDISAMLSAGVRKAYGLPVTPEHTEACFKAMEFFLALLRSRHGVRKRLLAKAEDIAVGQPILSSVIHYGAVEPGIDYLNLSKRPWSLPWDGAQTFTDSFPELFGGAIKRSVELINLCSDCWDQREDFQSLHRACGSASLLTGLYYRKSPEFKYFDLYK